MLMSRDPDSHLKSLAQADLGKVFRQGMLTNLLNPKVVLFFAAFLPQFVDPKRGSIPLQMATLGILFSVAGVTWNTVVGLISSVAVDWLQKHPAAARFQQRFAGVIFIGLGVRIALMERQ